MTQQIEIKEGYSFHYLIHAVFVIMLGIILISIHFLLAILVVTSGGILLLAKTGMLIDINKKNAFVYKSILGYKFGNSVNLKAFNHVRLSYKNESTKMQSRGPSNVIKTKTYTILLFTENKQVNHLYEFTEYRLALDVLNKLKTELGFTSHDDVAKNQELIQQNMSKFKRK